MIVFMFWFVSNLGECFVFDQRVSVGQGLVLILKNIKLIVYIINCF